MITGIGTDLVEIARVQKAIGRSAFLEKVYTERERELIAVRPVRAAGNFAAKEAVAKALGCGFAGIAPREIEVLREESGMPYVVLHGRAKEKAEKAGVTRIQISISDTAEYAQCYAVCEGTEERNREAVKEQGTEDGALFGVLPVLTAAGMKEADRITIEELGIPSLVLMERAALAVVCRVKVYAEIDSRIGVVCGTGNNGGDGVAVARMLKEEGYDVTVLLREPEQKDTGSEEFRQQLIMAEAFAVPVKGWDTEESFDVYVDAVFGIGLSKPAEGAYADIIEKINKEKKPVIAVDIPSGISADMGAICGTAVRATETVTFGAAKCGHLLYPGKEYTGKLTVARIGFPKEVLERKKWGRYLTGNGVECILPKRPAYSNKGTFGKVTVIAGSKNMAGAAYFAACAAYRTGAGLVKIAIPECNREILQTLLPEAMLAVYEEEGDLKRFVKELVNFGDAVIIGPGLGTGERAAELVNATIDVLKAMGQEAPPSVWDADGLNLLAMKMNEEGIATAKERLCYLEALLPEHAILTPHLGELARLTGEKTEDIVNNLWKKVTEFGKESDTIFVVKDAVTMVARKGDYSINTTGNNGMATGGSGDSLCGIIGALLAAKVEPFDAATAGVWLHGAAGDAAAREQGAASMLVRDLLKALGEIVEEMR